MSYDLSKAVGHESKPQEVSWNQRDLLLYAVGTGAKATQLKYVWEQDPRFAAFPTYPVVLPFKGTDQDVVDFISRVKSPGVPGLPNFDPNRIVHGSQYIEIVKPLPLTSGDGGFTIKRRISGIQENKSGIIVETESTLMDKEGIVYAKLYSGTFNVGAKVHGRFSKSLVSPPVGKAPPTDRKPDYVFQEKTTPEQAIAYRLSGDYNALHIDPRIGQAAGFGGPILHGLATFAFAARAIIETVGAGEVNSLKGLGVRFSSPVKPGETLETSIWEGSKLPNGNTEITFVTKNLETGKVCLSLGIAFIKKESTAARL